ncbi:MAG: transcription antitermination factor NusB, partial [Candidatus Omnitrophica bacterium]|nr:transcription antitermination factor NusB [Candidatus Omnitrophota bacterium]
MRKRTKAREYVVQMLYQVDITGGNWQETLKNFWEFNQQEDISAELKEFSAELLGGVAEHMQEIDRKISKYAANWQLERMAFVDRNIMRLGCFELIFREDIPPKVAINEAVEL